MCKVHIFREGHKFLQKLHLLFDWQYIGQIYGGDFAKICALLRMHELYEVNFQHQYIVRFASRPPLFRPQQLSR